MSPADGKFLLLFKRTKFCEFAAKMVEKKFKGKVLCEPLGTYSEGKKIMRASRKPASDSSLEQRVFPPLLQHTEHPFFH